MADARGGDHVPVLLGRCLELLGPAFVAASAAGRSPVLLDATLGLGGHAEAALAAHSRLRLIGLDRDAEALAEARQRLRRYASRVEFVHAVYDELPDVLARLGHPRVDGVLFDLGVSSLQLDTASRGFSYAQDAPLDMRMDSSAGTTAEHVVNTYTAQQLAKVLREYGEERFAARIAAAIVRERERQPVTSAARLVELVRGAIPAPARRSGGNPAKRTFQALRIEVNGELAALRRALPAALDALAPQGRMVALSYHSLEDRIVKRELAGRARSSAPVDLPFEPPGSEPTLRLLTRGAERADDAEVGANPRAASARLRAAERRPASGPAARGAGIGPAPAVGAAGGVRSRVAWQGAAAGSAGEPARGPAGGPAGGTVADATARGDDADEGPATGAWPEGQGEHNGRT